MKKVLLSNFKLDGKIILKKGQIVGNEIIKKYDLPFLPLLKQHLSQDKALMFVCSNIERSTNFSNNFFVSKIKAGGFQIYTKYQAILNLKPDVITEIFKLFPDIALSSVKNHSFVQKNETIIDLKFIDLRYQVAYLDRFTKYFKKVNFNLSKISTYLTNTLVVFDEKNKQPKKQTINKIIKNIDNKLNAANLNNKQSFWLNSKDIYQGLLECEKLDSIDIFEKTSVIKPMTLEKSYLPQKPNTFFVENKLIIMTLPTTIKNIHSQTIYDIKKLDYKVDKLGINYRPGNHSVICSKSVISSKSEISSKKEYIKNNNNKRERKINIWLIIIPISAASTYGKNHISSLDFLLELLLQNNLTNYLAGRGISNSYFGRFLVKKK